MAREDYQTEYNGQEMNIAKAIRLKKKENGEMNFNKLKNRFNLEVLDNINNIIQFRLYDRIYYYGLVSSKIRKKGEREWTGKVISYLKSELDDILSV
jgi:hypothetical protein